MLFGACASQILMHGSCCNIYNTGAPAVSIISQNSSFFFPSAIGAYAKKRDCKV